jgi:hypothetical protein
MVKNGEGAIIPRGTVVTWSSVAANNPAISELDATTSVDEDYVAGGGAAAAFAATIPYITVKDAIADGTAPGVTASLGVAAADIPVGGFGEIITYGLVKVLASAAITAGDVITQDAGATGRALNAANASHDNPFGIALEAATAANDLIWCFVNFIGAATGCSSTGFNGVAY